MKKILFVSNGATISGAPLLLLNQLKWLKHNTDYEFFILLTNNGPLLDQFKLLGKTFVWEIRTEKATVLRRIYSKIRQAFHNNSITKKRILNKIKALDPDLYYFNTVDAVKHAKLFRDQTQVPFICHVHELEFAIYANIGKRVFSEIIPKIDYFIAVAEIVSQNLIRNHSILSEKISVIYGAIPLKDQIQKETSFDFRQGLHLPDDAFIVISVGAVNQRKGVDLFLDIAEKCSRVFEENIFFIWIGGFDKGFEEARLKQVAKEKNIAGNVHFLGLHKEIIPLMKQADVFLLPSREDPFPLVCLEAASAGLPILCFDEAGGIPEFVKDDAGVAVSYLNVEKMAEAIINLKYDKAKRLSMSKIASERIKNYDISIMSQKIKTLIDNIININK